MKIAYYNPYVNSAENQIFYSMQIAGARIGHDLVECKDERDIYAFDPDFVISVSLQVPKVTHHPAYVAMHEPTSHVFAYKTKFQQVLSYDGYLTVSDSIVRFVRDFTYGVYRSDDPGFFYLTPQQSDLAVDWQSVRDGADPRIAYFGTNWRARMPQLLRRLDSMNILRIHGPSASWEKDGYAGYRGPVAFDGMGPQGVYAETGAGLVLMDQQWLQEDVISNRIFEISSVGAVAFCPDIPWIRKWFADSVHYFDPTLTEAEMAVQIKAGFDAMRADPDAAVQMGQSARTIFETHFSAEKMLTNAVAYHERKVRDLPARVAKVGPQAEITVIIRCGNRSVEQVREPVTSLIRQTFGKIHIVFAKFADLDLSALHDEIARGGLTCEEFLIPKGGRATMLYEGLKRIKTEYFAVLDDDDQLMPDHFEALFLAGRRMSPNFDVAFSGTIDSGVSEDVGTHTKSTRVIARFGYKSSIESFKDLLAPIHIGSLVARADLLAPDLIEAPDMKTAEDSLLIGIVARRSKPIFSYRASFLYNVASSDGSNWRTDPDRQTDERTLALRGGFALTPAWISNSPSINPRIAEMHKHVVQHENYLSRVIASGTPPLSSDRTATRSDQVTVANILRRPSILLGPLAPRWRAFKGRWRARR